MFNSIFGTITAKFPQILHLETSSGIEWSLSVSESTLNSLSTVGSQVRIYTWMYHKEDAMKLFGFSSIEERSVFLDLLKVDGVGPKGALKILSSLPYTLLVEALEQEDLSKLEKISGIGKKTAQKMLLTLKGKLTLLSENEKSTGKVSLWNDVIIALTNMGYDKKNCETVVEKISKDLDASLTQSAKEEIIFRKAIVELSL